MAFVYRLMEVVVERGKAGLSGLFKRIRYVLVELGLVPLRGQHVVSALAIIVVGHPIASMVTVHPDTSNVLSSSGMAVISLDRSSTLV